jgi:CheY-like chemotaxis protein
VSHAHEARLDAPNQNTTSPLRILAAEDNPMNRLVLKTLLAQVGLEVECVADGAEAIAAWEHQDWDAILMDVQMPVMDGPTATREIRRREAAIGRRRTPIIALTANAMAHQVDQYILAGMDGHVAKPIQADRAWPFPKDKPADGEAPPQSVTVESVRAGKATDAFVAGQAKH